MLGGRAAPRRLKLLGQSARPESHPGPHRRGVKEERPCLWEAVPEAPSLALPAEPAGCHEVSRLTEALRQPLGSPPPLLSRDCAFATVQHQHSCFSHPFTTGPNGVLVRSGWKPRGGPGPLPASVSSRPDHQVKEDAGRGGGPCPLEWVLLFMLAAQTIRRKKKKKSFVLFFHTCWLLFTYPANALALESFLQYAGERGGRQ